MNYLTRRDVIAGASGLLVAGRLARTAFGAEPRVRPDVESAEGKRMLKKYAQAAALMKGGIQIPESDARSWTYQWYIRDDHSAARARGGCASGRRNHSRGSAMRSLRHGAPWSALCIALGIAACGQREEVAQSANPDASASVYVAPPKEIIWVPETNEPPTDLEFESLRTQIAAGDVTLAGGQEIDDPLLWTSIVIARRSSSRYCTATLIGPNVLLTAAHCVDAKSPGNPAKTVGGTVRINGAPLQLKGCAMAPGYRESALPTEDSPRSSDDFALCEVVGNVGEGILETLDDRAESRVHAPILMSGYGCINLRVFLGKLVFDDGEKKLRVGEAKLNAVGVSDAESSPGRYLRTRTTDEEPILCPGDSGGPVLVGVTFEKQAGPRRRVVGVNSQVTAIPDGGEYVFFSYMSSTSTAAFNEFLEEWSAGGTGTRRVCGRHLAAGSHNCRA
jgi:hypothetical protein